MISDERSAAYVCAWIAGFVVIHNVLIALRLADDMGFDDLGPEIEADGPLESAERSAENNSGRAQRRTSLFEEFEIEKGYST